MNKRNYPMGERLKRISAGKKKRDKKDYLRKIEKDIEHKFINSLIMESFISGKTKSFISRYLEDGKMLTGRSYPSLDEIKEHVDKINEEGLYGVELKLTPHFTAECNSDNLSHVDLHFVWD